MRAEGRPAQKTDVDILIVFSFSWPYVLLAWGRPDFLAFLY